ncbi:MAG: heme exporter protein CcmD [Cocleimonas sp.]
MTALLGTLLGKYASYILGAMGAALFFMLLEPLLLTIKRRSVIQEVRRFKRLEDRQKHDNSVDSQ